MFRTIAVAALLAVSVSAQAQGFVAQAGLDSRLGLLFGWSAGELLRPQLGYVRLGSTWAPPRGVEGPAGAVQGLGGDLVFALPTSSRTSVLLSGGAYWLEDDFGRSGWEPRISVGGEFRILQDLSLRAEWEALDGTRLIFGIAAGF